MGRYFHPIMARPWFFRLHRYRRCVHSLVPGDKAARGNPNHRLPLPYALCSCSLCRTVSRGARDFPSNPRRYSNPCRCYCRPKTSGIVTPFLPQRKSDKYFHVVIAGNRMERSNHIFFLQDCLVATLLVMTAQLFSWQFPVIQPVCGNVTYSVYPASPCCVRSSPSVSWSELIRSPLTSSMTFSMIKLATNE